MGIVATVVLTIISALGGVFLWAWLSSCQEQRRQRRVFIEKQVQELYSPLLNILRQARALCEVRKHAAAEGAWAELCHEAGERGGPEVLQRLQVF